MASLYHLWRTILCLSGANMMKLAAAWRMNVIIQQSFSKLCVMTEIHTPAERDFRRSYYLCSQDYCSSTLHS